MKNLIISALILFSLAVHGQSTKGSLASSYWTKVKETKLANSPKVNRRNTPEIAHYFKLDLVQFKAILDLAPVRFQSTSLSNVIIQFPVSDGTMENFRVMESSIMHPDLEAKFPAIKTYVAQGIDDPTAYMRFSVTPFGLHTMTLSGNRSTNYIDPYTVDREYYIVYDRSSLGADSEPFDCLTDEGVGLPSLERDTAGTTGNMLGKTNDQNFRVFRLAQSCTAEYGNIFEAGGGAADIQAQMAITINRVNTVYEIDLAVQLQFIANNDQIIYWGATNADPWNGEWNTTTAQTIDAAIGVNNYDVGHNFNTTGGGNAGCLSCVCRSVSQTGTHKGRGYTGRANPTGDPFDIDYVAHEFGHQFGGYHTMNTCSRSGSGATEVEPCSGSSIMGYAGICATNVQNNSDAHFNYVNVRDISANIQSGWSTCASITALTNNPPTADAGNDYTIPYSTAFILEGTASDPDGMGSLTYEWSQNDPEQAPNNNAPSATWNQGPNYRAIMPTSSPDRYMPQLSDVIAGNLTPTWEVTPSVGRTMEFAFMVRDNDVAGGQTDDDLMQVTVDGSRGPFIVTSQGGATTWNAGTPEVITWNVANTTGGAINTANVDIFFSIDGGYTYPFTLATATPNDGSQSVNIPSGTATAQGKVMVRGSGNIFYALNGSLITVIESDFSITSSPTTVSECPGTNAVYSLTYNTFAGFSETTVFSAAGQPAGSTVTFSPSSASANGTAVTMTISGLTAPMVGGYAITITGTAPSITKTTDVTLNVLDQSLNAVTLTTPGNLATGIPVPTNFTWSDAGAGALYDIDISTDVGFSVIIDNATGLTATSFVSSVLNSNTTYYWRVRATNNCTTGPFSATYSFATNNCTTYMSTDIPVAISGTGTPTITSTLNIPINGSISDVNVVGLTGTHTWINDLTVTLSNPLGSSNVLWSAICNDENDFDVNFDDAATPGGLPCPPTGGGTYQPSAPLSVYNGTDPNGNWTLTISDSFAQDGGNLLTWGLEVCAAVDYTVTVAQPNVTVCASSSAAYSIDIGQAGTYTDPVAISITGVPATATATFSVNPVTPIGSSVLTVSNLNTVSPGLYNLFLNTTSNSGPKVENLTLVVLGTPGNTGLLTPADLASGVSTSVNFTWSPVSGAGITYEIEIAADPSFSSIVDNAVGLTSANYTSTALSSGTTYYWRVRAVNSCAIGSYTSTFSFTTSNCTTLMSTDVPVSIPGVGIGSSVLNFPTTGVISDVNVIDVSGTHNRIQQIQVRVTSPSATTAILWDRICANENNFNVSFDDAAAPGALPCPPIGGGTYQSQDALSAFNGENPSGTWTLTIQDFNGGGASANLQTWGLEVCIAPPSCSVSAASVSTSCNSGSDGIANSTPVSGTGPYTFLWDNAETTQNISGLSTGSYTVTMTDALACTFLATTSVTEPNILDFNISSTDESCSSINGSITAIPSGGTTPYNYNWSSGGTAQTENSLSAGNYSITVTDVKSCSTTSSVTISNIAGPTATTSLTDASCGANNGTATAIPTGGTGPYTYEWSSGGANVTESALTSGSYSVTVTDAGTCSVVENVTIGDTNSPTASITTTDEDCGQGNGTATAVPSGGAGGYTYTWSSSAGSGITENNLSAGGISVTVTDAAACSVTASSTINNIAGPTATTSVTDASCGASNGTATAIPTGGTGPYSYEWSSGGANVTESGLGSGSYSVTVIDNNSCVVTNQVVIESIEAPIITLLPIPATCEINNGSIMSEVIGETGSLNYQWSNGEVSENISGLDANIYSLTITDENNCTVVVDTIIIRIDGLCFDPPPSGFSPNGDNINDVWNIPAAQYYSDIKVEIYNRWGSALYISDGYTEPWDGLNANGKEVPSAVYYYIITLDEKSLTGTVTIKR